LKRRIASIKTVCADADDTVRKRLIPRTLEKGISRVRWERQEMASGRASLGDIKRKDGSDQHNEDRVAQQAPQPLVQQFL